MPRGRFIVVEGAEGTGKTTQAGRLRAFLHAAGLDAVGAREPGGTRVGERIRELVLHGSDLAVPPETELLLILAARSAFVRRVVEPALAGGSWVVSDRFDMSTFAYQGYGRELGVEPIAHLNAYATAGLVPDLYIVLDLPVEEGMARQKRQGKGGDRFESAAANFHHRVRQGYVELSATHGNAVLVPACGSPDEVESRIRREVVSRFPETSGRQREGGR